MLRDFHIERFTEMILHVEIGAVNNLTCLVSVSLPL